MKVIADTGPLVAAANRRDRAHELAAAIVWARRAVGDAWRFDLIVGAGSDAAWRSRRDLAIEVPWPIAVRRDHDVPYLTPHLQLLMKSKDVRRKDDVDVGVVAPHLSKLERAWLAQHLDAEHGWQKLLT